jgi:hypothetical protein
LAGEHSNRTIAEIIGVGEATLRRDRDAPNDAPLDAIAALAADEKVRSPPGAIRERAFLFCGVKATLMRLL